MYIMKNQLKYFLLNGYQEYNHLMMGGADRDPSPTISSPDEGDWLDERYLNRQFIRAIENKDMSSYKKFEKVKDFIKRGANVMSTPFDDNNSNGYTPLHAAVRYGEVKIASYLLDIDANPYKSYVVQTENTSWSPYSYVIDEIMPALDNIIENIKTQGADQDNWFHDTKIMKEYEIIKKIMKNMIL